MCPGVKTVPSGWGPCEGTLGLQGRDSLYPGPWCVTTRHHGLAHSCQYPELVVVSQPLPLTFVTRAAHLLLQC